MGRTNSTYRNHLDNLIKQFKPFKKALRERNKQHLDQLWEKTHKYSSAGAYMNHSNPALPALISIMLGMQKEINKNREQLEQIKKSLENQ